MQMYERIEIDLYASDLVSSKQIIGNHVVGALNYSSTSCNLQQSWENSSYNTSSFVFFEIKDLWSPNE